MLLWLITVSNHFNWRMGKMKVPFVDLLQIPLTYQCILIGSLSSQQQRMIDTFNFDFFVNYINIYF